MLLNKRALFISFSISCAFHVLLLVSFVANFTPLTSLSFSLAESNTNSSIMRVELKESKLLVSKKGRAKAKKKVVTKSQKKNLSKSKKSNGQNSLYAKYISEVRDIIQKNQSYPTIAKRLKMEGKVKLKFEIKWPNKIVNIDFADKSKFELLNKSAKKILDKIENFPVIPDQLEMKSVQVVVPIVYEIL